MELTESILVAEDGKKERNLLLTEEEYRRRYAAEDGNQKTAVTSRRIKYCKGAEELHSFLTGRYNSAGREFWLDREESSPQCLQAAGEALRRKYGREGEWPAYMQGKTGRRAQKTAGCMAGTVEPVRVLAACRKLMDLYEGDETAEDILAGMASEILDVSPDRILELLHEHRDEIEIISGEAE